MPGGSTHGAGGVIINIRKVCIEMVKNALCSKPSHWLHLNRSLPVDLCMAHTCLCNVRHTWPAHAPPAACRCAERCTTIGGCTS